MSNHFLESDVFKTIVENTPLISIDLIIENNRGEVLVGERVNRPAKGFLFVPGGRIMKDETISQAFKRITGAELGIPQPISSASFQGVYQHFYEDNFSEDDFSTHYVVLAYKMLLNSTELNLPLEQHNSYCWVSISNVLEHTLVHNYTKDYFRTVL